MARITIDNKWMSPMDVVAYVGSDPKNVYEAINSGELKAYIKPWANGKKKSFILHQDDVDTWMRSWPAAIAYRDRVEE